MSLPVSVACAKLCTICLQLYLEALPEDKGQWINKTKELRSCYEKIKETVRAPPCGHLIKKKTESDSPKVLQLFIILQQRLNKSHSGVFFFLRD